MPKPTTAPPTAWLCWAAWSGCRQAWAFFGIIAFSGALEILQGYTGRDPDIFDFIANSFGACIGLAAGLLFLWRPGSLVAVRRTD